MNRQAGVPSAIIARFFQGAAALAAVTFIVAAIIDGYEAEIAGREAQYFTTHGTVFFVIALVAAIAALFFSIRTRKQLSEQIAE